MANSVQFSTLGNPSAFRELGAGGEGRVFEVPGLGNLVYKEFFPSATSIPDLQALERLISARESWSPDEQSWMNERSVWPISSVLENGRLKGLLMPRIPKLFYRSHGIKANPRVVLCEWNYLALRNRFGSNPNIFSDVPRPETFQVIELILDLSRTMSLLHAHDIVLGDVSGKNLLWTDRPSFRVFAIDNDGFRFIGTGGIASPKQSPDWEDPVLAGRATTPESDIYKLGLAAFRALWSAGTDKPTMDRMNQSVGSGISKDVVDLIAQSTLGPTRPSSADWVSVLAPIVALRGRPSVSVALTASPNPSISHATSTGVNRSRPVIPVHRNIPKP